MCFFGFLHTSNFDISRYIKESEVVKPKRIVQRKRGTFAVTVQTAWFTAILKHPYEVGQMLRETSESVIVFKMHLTGLFFASRSFGGRTDKQTDRHFQIFKKL